MIVSGRQPNAKPHQPYELRRGLTDAIVIAISRHLSRGAWPSTKPLRATLFERNS